MHPVIVAHGGVGSGIEYKEDVVSAVKAGYEALLAGKSALEAVIITVKALEDNVKFNAGYGSYYNLAGEIEMDASVMTSDGRCGAVACVHGVKNPVLLARAVMDTPHVLMAGRGAVEYAKKIGLEFADLRSEKADKKLAEVKKKIREGYYPQWSEKMKNIDLSEYLGDTVGAVAMDMQGKFAAANSTGGISLKLPGRVGDSAIIGAGIYAGSEGAVVTTGIGEEIIRKVLAKSVYDKLAQLGAMKACRWGVDQYDEGIPVGIIAVDKKGYGVAANKQMAWHVLP